MNILTVEITSVVESKSDEFKFVNHKTIKTQFRFDVKSFQ